MTDGLEHMGSVAEDMRYIQRCYAKCNASFSEGEGYESEMEKHEIVNRVGCLKMRLGWYYRYCNHIALVKSIGMNG